MEIRSLAFYLRNKIQVLLQGLTLVVDVIYAAGMYYLYLMSFLPFGRKVAFPAPVPKSKILKKDLHFNVFNVF